MEPSLTHILHSSHIYPTKYTYTFPYMHSGMFSHHSCITGLLYAKSIPQKPHLMRHKGLYPAIENTSCMLNSSFDYLTTGFFNLFLFFFSVLPDFSHLSWLPLKNSTSFFFFTSLIPKAACYALIRALPIYKIMQTIN